MNIWHDPHTQQQLTYDDVGSGPPLVLVHAFPLNRTMWQDQHAALAGHVRLLMPDLPGCGGSSLPDIGWTIDSAADGIERWLTQLGITEPILFGGLSMGGYLSLAFARRHPTRVRGLILADTGAQADTPDAKAKRDTTITTLHSQSVPAFFDDMLPRVTSEFTRTQQPEVVERLRGIAAQQSVAGIVGCLQALRDRVDSTPHLPAITVPALVIVGQNDTITPLASSQAIVAGLPNATLQIVERAGHFANIEESTAFNTVVSDWLNTMG